MKRQAIYYTCLFLIAHTAVCQTYSPITVSGFTQDIFAEAGTNAAALTTTDIDASNHVMYTVDFAAANGLPGGVSSSGTIVTGSRTYQLAPFNSNNAVYLSLSYITASTTSSSTLTVLTPARYTHISFLSFSTEGSSTINVVLRFTDGTIFNAGDFVIQDWFGGPNPIYSGFGRITRLPAPPYTLDGLPNDPGWYEADIPISCTDQSKLLQSITINYIAQGGTNSRDVVLAFSGVASAATPIAVSGVITPATCNANNGSIVLTTTGGNSPFSYSWNTVPLQTTAAATGLGPGTYTATITDANGCAEPSYTATVTQTAFINATAMVTPLSICSGDSATLTATAIGNGNTYTWNPGGQTGASIQVSPAVTTTYTVTVGYGNGCTTNATATLAVKQKPTADFRVSPEEFCLPATATITFTGNADAETAYHWDFAGATVMSGAGAGPYILSFSTPGSHDIRLTTSQNGCRSSEVTQTVIADAHSQPLFTTMPASICSGSTVQVVFSGKAAPGATPVWNWDGGTVLSGSGTGPFTVRYDTSGSIQLIISNNTCMDTSAKVPIAVTPQPVAAFTPDVLQGCTPLTVSVTNTSGNAASYYWNFGDSTHSTDQMPAPHAYTIAGNYQVRLTTTNGNCNATSPMQVIQVSDPPVADFSSTPDVTVTPPQTTGTQFRFNNRSVGATAYLWKFGDNDSSRQTNPTHLYKTTGAFAVTLYAFVSIGCADSISIAPYIIVPDSTLRIPNAFSPNGDGINDRWIIPGLLNYADCQVQVFDRYGKLVFKSTGYNTPWDGRQNNQELPVGTYYYTIETRLKVYTGWVFMAR